MRGVLLLGVVLLSWGAVSGQGDGIQFPGLAEEQEQEPSERTNSGTEGQGRQILFGSGEEEEEEEEQSNNSEKERFVTRTTEAPACLTTGSGDAPKNTACILPFIYQEVTHNGCTTKGDPDDDFWCSTKVNDDGIHIKGGGNWGHCNIRICPLDEEGIRETAGKIAEQLADDDGENLLGLREGDSEDDDDDDEDDDNDAFESCVTNRGRSGHCRPASLCVGLSSQDEADNECDIPIAGSDSFLGVCCEERLKNDITISFSSGHPGDGNEVQGLDGGRVEDIIIGERFLSDPSPSFGGNGNSLPEPDLESIEDPVSFHLKFNQPSNEAVSVDRKAAGLVTAANEIQTENELTDEQAGIGLRLFNSESSDAIDDVCPWTPGPKCNSEQEKLFRKPDGSCNNFKETNYGRAITPFQRILLPKYSGKLQLPRESTAGAGLALPSARLLSTSMTDKSDVGDSKHTVLVMQMGQFIDHDITHTPNHAASGCCNKDGSFPSSFDPVKCHPIKIPQNDPFWKGRKTCMALSRSLSSPGLKCELEFKQQMNQITHWLDNSNIYGSSETVAARLRTKQAGQMKVTSGQRERGSRASGALPSCSAQKKGAFKMCNGCSSCFVAGDVRANEQLNLIVLHTVWLREHNRIARFLQRMNPHWDDERLYQEARRITTAEYQHVVYKEWLPIILGSDFMTSFGLWPLTKGSSKDYKDDFDPRITNEFATAAFRFGHSLIPQSFNRVPRGARNSRQAAQSLNLRDTTFSPSNLQKNPGLIDDLVRGLVTQEGDLWDNSFTPAIQDHLFERGSSSKGGLDLVALNVQRGRDHGLPSYNDYRAICETGSGRAKSFDDLTDVISPRHAEKLRRLYRSVDDIDLYIGGFLEKAHGDSILGPTFKCIIGDQFARLKLGDRFFYDLGNFETTAFKSNQLQEIRKTSMSRILCDNTDSLDTIQPQAFKLPGSSRANREVSCDDSLAIPRVNLGVFGEASRRG